MTPTSVTGSCFCGVVKFEIELPTLFCGHCHCTMCRRPHGASFVTWTAVPPEQFKITAGEQDITLYKSSEHGTRSFCRICGSQMFCQTEPEAIDIALAALHGKIDRDPEEHYYFDSRADWTVVNDDLPKLGGESGDEPL
ncbi:MAG: GFA family protein [Alphaproteobacteria bacterium]